MASFAHNLRSFRSGNLSLEDLLQELEGILAGGRAEATWLLATLREEQEKAPLPAEAFEKLSDRLEPLAQHEEERVQPEPERTAAASGLDAEGVHMATAYRPAGPIVEQLQRKLEVPGAQLPGYNNGAPIEGTRETLNNRFKLERRVGSGGMSTVYKAIDCRKLEANDRNPYVAVKVLNLEFREHPDSLIALQREAKKSQSLAHPNIVRVYDFDRDGSTVYMTMEYLSGESLARKTDEAGFRGLPQKEALKIINDMGEALRFAHNSGIVHADFKPANVLITDDGKVKVIDFGIARAFRRDDTAGMEATRFDPGSLGALTPTYASPEMLERQEPDPRDDVYALACTAYEVLTGRHPFGRLQATSARDGGLKLKRQEALTRRQFKALRHALEFDREKRTRSVAQFLKEINCEVRAGDKLANAVGLAAVVIIVGGGAGYVYFAANRDTGTPDESLPSARTAEQAPASTEPPDETPRMSEAESPASEPEDLRTATAAAPIPESTEPPKAIDTVPVITPVEIAAPQDPAPRPTAGKRLIRDDVAPVISRVPCSALLASVDAATVHVRGYARWQDETELKKTLVSLAGPDKVDLSAVQTLDGGKCAAIEILAMYWDANQELAPGASISSRGGKDIYLEGEHLVLEIETPAYPSYVYVDYYMLDGGVLHLIPSPRFTANQAPPRHRATIGDLGEWAIAPPFGTEMVVITTTPEPLFDPMRREYESQKDYLPALRKRLAEIEEKTGKHQVVADILLIRTKEG